MHQFVTEFRNLLSEMAILNIDLHSSAIEDHYPVKIVAYPKFLARQYLIFKNRICACNSNI